MSTVHELGFIRLSSPVFTRNNLNNNNGAIDFWSKKSLTAAFDLCVGYDACGHIDERRTIEYLAECLRRLSSFPKDSATVAGSESRDGRCCVDRRSRLDAAAAPIRRRRTILSHVIARWGGNRFVVTPSARGLGTPPDDSGRHYSPIITACRARSGGRTLQGSKIKVGAPKNGGGLR
jgi:hypothetical protein